MFFLCCIQKYVDDAWKTSADMKNLLLLSYTEAEIERRHDLAAQRIFVRKKERERNCWNSMRVHCLSLAHSVTLTMTIAVPRIVWHFVNDYEKKSRALAYQKQNPKTPHQHFMRRTIVSKDHLWHMKIARLEILIENTNIAFGHYSNEIEYKWILCAFFMVNPKQHRSGTQ